jgi:hypothetical protein
MIRFREGKLRAHPESVTHFSDLDVREGKE